MKYYVLRRILLLIPTSLAVMTFVFLVVRVLPGDPAISMLGAHASEEAIKALREQLGLNHPLWKQYVFFIRDVVNLEFGKSMITGSSVISMTKRALLYTADLVFTSMIISILIGIPLGLLTAVKRNSWVDYSGRLFALLGLSIPDFFLGILLILIFSIKLNLLPVIGGGDSNTLSMRLTHLILPSFTLGLIVAAFITRMTRSTILEILGQQYIKVAHAKGVSERVVIYKHALRNALVPIVTVIGIYINILLGGTVLVETVFNRPGLGKLIVGAIMQRDYVVLQSVLMIFSLFVVLVNLTIDIAYRVIDPRIQYK
jgi:ABC-type dipeptide/oligopeptide/nickel transport system permease component